MKIKMICSVAGVVSALSPGDETERFSQSEAIRLIEAGYAVPVAETEIERAIVKPIIETRDEPHHKNKKSRR